jgi:hypothetical protein
MSGRSIPHLDLPARALIFSEGEAQAKWRQWPAG